jgi:hypothetical protein
MNSITISFWFKCEYIEADLGKKTINSKKVGCQLGTFQLKSTCVSIYRNKAIKEPGWCLFPYNAVCR